MGFLTIKTDSGMHVVHRKRLVSREHFLHFRIQAQLNRPTVYLAGSRIVEEFLAAGQDYAFRQRVTAERALEKNTPIIIQ